MRKSIIKSICLAAALTGIVTCIPTEFTILNIQAEASESIKGISFLKVYEKKGTSNELQLYSDMECTNKTDYKSSINKYYVKLPAEEGKFNININTKAEYSIKVYFDDSQYTIGDIMEVMKGETSDVRIRVYKYNEDDDRDEIQGTVTLTVMRDSDKTNSKAKGETATNSKNVTNDIAKNYTTIYTSDNISSNIIYKNKWVQKGINWVYYDANGNTLKDQWFKDSATGKYYYLKANGYMTTGWRFINSDWYYFNKDGSMATGWIKDSETGIWYYLYSNGKMAKNTVINGYKININGKMI